jgi:hypothetical protein
MLTTQQCVDYFLVLQDKYGSPSVTQSEVVDFLNHGINEYLNRIFPDNEGAVVNFEQDKNVTATIQPLIYTFAATTAGTGLLTTAALNTLLATDSGIGSAEFFRVGDIGLTFGGITYPVKYVRSNNLWAFSRNYFKKPSLTRPKYELISKGILVYPAGTQTLTISVIKKPKVLSLTGPVNPELEDYVMYSVIAIALQLAGVSTRDEAIIQDIRNITLQGK